MPERATLARVANFWAQSLGCDLGVLSTPGVTVLPNAAEFADYQGAYLLRWGATCVFSVPEPYNARVLTVASERSPDQVFDPAALAQLFSGAVERIIGPASRNCTDSSEFQPVNEWGTRQLTPADDASMQSLAATCDPTEWQDSGIGAEGSVTFGCFRDKELVAAGMLLPRGAMRNIGIISHPSYRGRGYGRAVVAAMTRAALAEGAVPHYQTLASNGASLAVARALGFSEYAQSLAVRLKG